MKKFLSLVLALVMAMSLVTISAGATEYKDLTDKDEIQYEEAVAVLNRIGVITGYDDGSFQPTRELTRGAAAKIIVSLLIGPEAANNLPNNSSPYPDVPANHTFAGVISFCKTKNIISGYGDGTFKPANSLTGYAFAKMLLCAVGYDSDIERFTGSGWTNNVAAIGQSASLFDRLQFDGSAAVNREQACQLALNALKATVVEYSNGINVNVTGENTNVVVSGGQVRSYKTSNQEFARNIRTQRTRPDDAFETVEFAEEHFIDLRLEADKWNPTDDEFGRPSAEWSYKKVTIGTYALEPDFTYNTQQAHAAIDDDAAKVRALGLRGYELHADGADKDAVQTTLWINGVEQTGANRLTSVGNIADYTDNGTVVNVYVSEDDADFITDVVVIHTQLMEVKRVGSDYVALDLKDGDKPVIGHAFNQDPLDVEMKDTKDDNENYAMLKELKAGDLVAVVPVADNHSATSKYVVSKAYVPETVTGTLTRTDMYDDEVVELTVGGTSYKAAQWNKDMKDIDATTIKVTRKDVTLHMDEFGNALLIEDAGSTSEYMIIGNYYKSLENGRLVDYVHGWDVGGEEIDLNLGINGERPDMRPGDLVRYTSNTSNSSADWILEDNSDNSKPAYHVAGKHWEKAPNIYNVDIFATNTADGKPYELRASNNSVKLMGVLDNDGVAVGAGTRDEIKFMREGAKVIFVTFDDVGDVDTIEFQKNSQNVANKDLAAMRGTPDAAHEGNIDTPASPAGHGDGIGDTGDYEGYNSAEAYFDKDGNVRAVVVKTESGTATSSNLLYVKRHWNGHVVTENAKGQKVYGYEVAMMTKDGLKDDVQIWANRELGLRTFASYTESTLEGYEPYYTVKSYDQAMKTTSTMHLTIDSFVKGSKGLTAVAGAWEIDGTPLSAGTQGVDEVTGQPNGTWTNTTANILTDLYSLSSTTARPTGAGIINLGRAEYVDMTGNGIDNWDDLKDFENVVVDVIINDNIHSDTFRVATLVVVTQAEDPGERPAADAITVTIDQEAITSGADAGKIRLTANVADLPANGTIYSYRWYKVGDNTNTLGTGKTLVVSTTEEATYNCEVTYKVKDKELPSSGAIAATPVAITPAPAVDGVKIAVPTAANTNRGEAITYKAVATVNGEAVTSNANIRYTWKIDEVDAETLGATVKVNTDGTTELVIPANIAASMAGKTVTCEPSVIDAAGTETPVVIAPEDVEKVEQTETGAIGTTHAKDTNVPAQGDLPDSPTATDAVVTFEIGANTMVTYKGATLTSASPSTFTVAKGEIITVVAEKMGSASGVVSVTPGESIVFVDGTVGSSQRFVVNASGTITVSLEAPDLNKVAAAFTKTALADKTSSIPANVLNAGYDLTTSAGDGKITLAFRHTGLYGHTNANGGKAYQIGFNVPKTIDGWTVSNVTVVDKWKNETADPAQGYVNFGYSSEGGCWLTLYRACAPGGSGLGAAMEDNGVTSGTVTLTKSDVNVEVPLVVDCSNVVVYKWDTTYTQPEA